MELPDLSNILIGGTPVAVLVIALVALAKRLGMPDSYAPWLNGALSTFGYLGSVWLVQFPEYMAVAQIVTAAVMIFIVSSGTYQLSKVGK